ncbi:MAG TPA: ABC transporter ATP-binding protein [Tepidisphaeraceae bacterium]|jgi:NitT/TauT family transport system ATP-binding protein|nr:ABC transporter ATP-binding protein [Tepidisphaeraceae bacterium]
MPVTEKTLSAAGVKVVGAVRTFNGGVCAVDHLSLEIGPGEFVAILGPSGCGKSTLLRMIAGLDRPDQGVVQVEGDTSIGRVGYVFQDAHLLPWRNVLTNVALPLELAGVDHAERITRATAVLSEVGLGDFIHRYPAELSGGMRMRVSLARALVTSPVLLLMDEPFAALDEITRQKLDEMLRQLWAERDMTIVFVTHSIAEASFLAERAVVLTRRPARIVTDHAIDLPVDRPAVLRGESVFAREMRTLYAALEEGMRA